MLTWLTLVTATVKLLSSLTTFFQERGWVNTGVSEEQNAEMTKVLQELADASQLRIKVNALTPDDLDKISEAQGWIRKPGE